MAQKILTFVAIALGGIALLVSLLASPPAPPPPMRAVASDDDVEVAADVQELRERIASLEDSLQYQARRINALEAAQRGGAGQAGAAASVADAELARLRDDVHSLMVGEAVNSESGREHLKDAVRSVQEEMRQEQRQRREQEAAEAMARVDATREQRWKDFAQKAGLNYQQEQTVISAVTSEAEKRKALMEQVQRGEKSRREVRPALRALQSDTEQQVKSLLSDDQWKQFQDERREERRAMRGGGGGGGFGNRGGGRGAERGARGQ